MFQLVPFLVPLAKFAEALSASPPYIEADLYRQRGLVLLRLGVRDKVRRAPRQ